MHVGDLVEQWTVLGEERELIAGVRGATRIYMALMSLDPTGKGRKRGTMHWKAPECLPGRRRGPPHPSHPLTH